ncbi:MAG TPA: A24 family peptidase [Anaerolineales bacterium]|nr:A24 family peptidase [Anaerolineales bacterium]
MDAFIIVPILLGWLAGLFVNYASDVLPVSRRFSQPVCPHCQTPFPWVDYLTLRACRSCGKGRNVRTWLVQLLAVASFVYFWLFPSNALGYWLGAIILIYFGIITVIDLEHRLILHPTSLFGAILGLVVGTYLYYTALKYSFLASVGASLLGGLIGFGVMFLFYQLGAIVARYRARKMQAAGQEDDGEEALGGGDVYLLGVLGLMVGSKFIPDVLARGIILGGLVSLLFIVAILLRRKYSSDALMTFIPYGPYFILAAFYTLFF